MEETKLKFEFGDMGGNSTSVEITGESAVPFWHDDLKLKVATELVSTVDWKNVWDDDEQRELVSDLLDELQEQIKNLTEL